jgi:hypothetical protein
VKIGLKSEEVGGGDVFDRRVTLAWRLLYPSCQAMVGS